MRGERDTPQVGLGALRPHIHGWLRNSVVMESHQYLSEVELMSNEPMTPEPGTRHALAKDADALTPEDTAELQRQLARLDKRRAEISLDYRSNHDNDYRANLFEAVLDIGTNSAEALIRERAENEQHATATASRVAMLERLLERIVACRDLEKSSVMPYTSCMADHVEEARAALKPANEVKKP